MTAEQGLQPAIQHVVSTDGTESHHFSSYNTSGPGAAWPSDGPLNGSNTSAAAYVLPALKQPVHMIIIYTLAYTTVFFLGIFGNIFVVSVVKRNKHMHTVTNYFIVNLAIADILVCLFVLPITLLSNLYRGWLFGAVMCKATPFLQGVSVCASVNTLTAIAFDRFLAICFTLRWKITKRSARVIIVLIWITAAAVMTPWAVYYQQKRVVTATQTFVICSQFWPSKAQEKGYFLGAIFLFCYSIPLVLITACYTSIALRVWHRDAPGAANQSDVVQNSKVKVVKMLVGGHAQVVVVLFAFSWLPVYAVRMRTYFGTLSSREIDVIVHLVVPVVQWMGAANSCSNPIVYCFFSRRFRLGFSELIKVCCCYCRRARDPRRAGHLYSQFSTRTAGTSLRRADNLNGYSVYNKLPVRQRYWEMRQQGDGVSAAAGAGKLLTRRALAGGSSSNNSDVTTFL